MLTFPEVYPKAHGLPVNNFTLESGLVVHTCNLMTGEAEAGES
jgi:hypothetical protein